MNKILGIIGAGHLGQQIAHHAISDGHFNEVLFFDDFTREEIVAGFKVAGETNRVKELFQSGKFTHLMIGIGYKHMKERKMFFEKFSGYIPFATIIHSSSYVDGTVNIDEGTIVYPNCIIDAGVRIGSNVLVNVGGTISHDTVVNSHSFLSPRVALAGFITIGEQCIIGINSTLIDNISITDSVQIGGGTVVINDIDKKGLYVGNPARFIR